MTLEELSKLDYQGAMELMVAYSTDIKMQEKELEPLKKEAELWASRVSLAESKALPDLAQAARERHGQIQEKIAALENSILELKLDVARLKEALPGLKAKERSIDPDQLLAELSMMTGEAMDPEKAKFDREFAALERAGGSMQAPEKAQSSEHQQSTPPSQASSAEKVSSKQNSAASAGPQTAPNPAAPHTAASMDDALAALKRKLGL
ncbi:MAG: hypothetical protein LWX00_00245 [Spirochaetia bacterium]|nr:hypothetical protein [Spirochaetia bacterium]